MYTVLSIIDTHTPARRPGVSRSNIRSRRQRLDALRMNWAEQIDELKTAYLGWKHKSKTAHSSTSTTRSTSSDVPFSAEDDASRPEPSQPVDTHVFEVTAIWTHSGVSRYFVDVIYHSCVRYAPSPCGQVHHLAASGRTGKCCAASPRLPWLLTCRSFGRIQPRHIGALSPSSASPSATWNPTNDAGFVRYPKRRSQLFLFSS